MGANDPKVLSVPQWGSYMRSRSKSYRFSARTSYNSFQQHLLSLLIGMKFVSGSLIRVVRVRQQYADKGDKGDKGASAPATDGKKKKGKGSGSPTKRQKAAQEDSKDSTALVCVATSSVGL